MSTARRNARRWIVLSSAAATALAGVVNPVLMRSATGATNLWTNGNSTNSWNDPLNWGLGTTPGTTDALSFTDNSPNASPIIESSLDGSFTSQTLSFNTPDTFNIDANSVSGGLTTTQTLTLTGGTNANGGTDLISLSANTSGVISMGATAGVGTLGIVLGTSGNINIANAAGTLVMGSNSVISGAFNLSQSGPGTLTLAGANTFGGAGNSFTLNSGTLNINNAAALGNSANTFVINGGTVANSSGGAITTANYAQTWSGDFTFGAGSALNLGTGAVTLTPSATRTITANGNTTVGGVISGTGSSLALASGSTGTLTLTGNNTYTGGTTISGGTLSARVSTGSSALGNGAITLAGGTLQLAPVATTTTNGLSERIFATTGLTDTTTVNFAGTALSTATVPNLASATTVNGITTNGAAQFLGKLSITNAGAYKFFTSSDDGSRIFIDGVLVVNNDGPKGPTDSGSAAITLSSGLHDIRVDYIQGGGGLGETLSWSGGAGLDVGATETAIPTTALFAAESNTTAGASNAVIVGTGVGDTVNLTSSSTINLAGTNFTQVQVGNLSFNTGTALTVTGAAGKGLRAGGNVTLNSGAAGTTTITNTPDVYLDGVLSDGGNATTLTKLGTGRLVFDQTTAANNLLGTSTIDVQAGTATLVGGSVAGFNNDPIGAAKLQFNGGNVVLDTEGGGALSYNNAINVLQSGTLQDVANAVTTTLTGSTLNINSGTTLTVDAIAGGQPVSDQGATLVIADSLTGSGKLAITSSVLGTFATASRGTVQITSSLSGFTGNLQVLAGNLLQTSTSTGVVNFAVELSGGNLVYSLDGDGTSTPQTLVPGDTVTVDTANSGITVGRLGTTFTPFFATAANKSITLAGLSIGAQTLTVTNNNGYGLNVTGPTTISAAPTFSVATATGSNVVPGLTLSGAVTSSVGFTKAGAGTLLLTNAGNNFGTSNTFDITGGILAASNDGALGDSSNIVKLDISASTGVGFRATSTFASSHSFQFGVANNGMEVSSGNSLTLNSAFLGATATTQLDKNDDGTLILNADNTGTTWGASITAAGATAQTLTGGVLVNAGALRITNNGALGPSTNIIAVSQVLGAAVQLANGVTVNNILDLNTTTTNAGANGGINGAGQLDSISGSNTWSGAISENQDSTVGAEAGATLNITGGVNQNVHILFFNGAGNINVSGGGLTAVHSLTKNGTGTTTISAAVAAPSGNGITINGGTLDFSGAGVIAAGGTKPIIINPGGTLIVDDSLAAPATHLGGEIMTFVGGTFNYIGNNGATSAETVGAPTFNRGNTIITVTPGSGQQANLTFSANSNSPGNAQNNATAPTGATVLFRGTSLGSAAGPSVATIKDSGTTGFTFNGQTGATGTTTKGIMPWALIDNTVTGNGISFATGDAAAAAAGTTAILRPLNTATEMVTNLFTASTNVLLNAAQTLTATTNINSLTMTGTGGITISPQQFLTLSSGGILANPGNTGITGGVLSAPAANSPLTIWALGNLTIGSVLSGGNGSNPGLIKSGAGTLTLTAPTTALYSGLSANTFNAQTDINQGTLLLSSAAGPTGVKNVLGGNTFLEIGPAGTLDLNGTSQYVSGLFSDGTLPGAGGTIQSTGTQGTLIANEDNTGRTWAGNITGNIYFNHTGQNTWSVSSAQTYTGPTLINGGTVSLRDSGSLLSTTAIDINFATLLADNNQATDLPDRISNTAPITLRGGILQVNGRAQTASSETVGAVSFVLGSNVINATPGGTGVNSLDVTLASIANSGDATVNFVNGTGLGTIGSAGRILINSINGVSTATLGGGLTTNNIIGAWAIAGTSNNNTGNREWASYNPTFGVGSLNQTGFAGYSNDTLATAVPTDNIRITATPAALTTDTTAFTLNVNYAANTTVDLGTHKLTLAGGGLLLATGTSTTALTIQNGTLTAGTTSSPTDLYVYFEPIGGTARTGAINAVIANNAAGGAVRLVYTASDAANNVISLGGTNTYTGGTVVNAGGLFIGATGTLPAGGLTINGGANLTQLVGGVVTPQIVTLNGSGTLTLVGNNTLPGLVFNDIGGGATAPTVNTSSGGVTPGNNTLTIGASGIAATGSNVGSTSIVQGRLDFGASPNTIAVDPIFVNGIDAAQLQANLALTGISGSTGGITKTGQGVLQLNAQEVFTGQFTIAAGTLNFGGGAANGAAGNLESGSRFADFLVNSGTKLNLNNIDATIGSLSGSGSVINASVNGGATLRTLNVGFDNTSTTFSGGVVRLSDGSPGTVFLNKIGTGTLTMTGVSTVTSSPGLQVSQGQVTFNGAGQAAFLNYNTLPGGLLLLDNSGNNLSFRLGQSTTTGTITLGGGEIKIIGNPTAGTTEATNTFTYAGTGGMSTITLAADPAQSLTLNWGNGNLNFNNGATVLIRGLSTTVGAGNANFIRPGTALNVNAGQGGFGTVALPTVTETIRPDMLGDASATGSGTGFITQDSSTFILHPLGASELATTLINSAITNFGLSAPASVTAATAANTLTLSAGGGIANANPAAFGRYDPTATALALTLTSGGVLVQNGASVINVGNIIAPNSPYFFWTLGNTTSLQLTGSITSANPISKNGTGSLTINSQTLNATQQVNVNGGTLILNAGNNTLAVSPTSLTEGQFSLSGGTLDLNGNSQIAGTLTGATPYANSGGTITNSAGGAPVTYTTISNSAQTFGGVITGNLNFNKTGNNALTLTSPNTFTGTTTLRENTTTLRDLGAFSNTSSVSINYAALNLDQSGLNPLGNLNPTRIPAATPINLVGGTLIFTGGGSLDSSATFNSVTGVLGHDTISVPAPTGIGGTSQVTVGNLQLGSTDTTFNFVGGGNGGNFFTTAPGVNNSELFIGTINGAAITLTNKVLGGWALANNGEFATYVTSATPGSGGLNWGVVTMNGPATIAQTQYDSNTTTFPASNAASNVRLTATATIALPTGGATWNVLAVRAATPSITYAAATDVLNLTTGGLALTNGGTTLGAVGSGFLTSGATQSTGTAPLYIYSNGNTNTVATTIENNPAGAIVRSVLVPIANQLNISGINTYTGGTVINGAGGGVTLNGAVPTAAQITAGQAEIPKGGLTINNATLTMATNAGQIDPTNAVTLNGGAVLTLVGSNTLSSLTFNTTGSNTTPSVAVATLLTLNGTNTITALNDNINTIPTISGTALALTNASPTISVSGLSPSDLIISAPITSAGGNININPTTSTGMVDLTAQSTFTSGVTLSNGTIMFGASSTGTASGPVGVPGTSTLTLANNTALMSDGTIRTIGNNVTINGNMTFGALNQTSSPIAGNGVILSGPVTFSTTAHTIFVNTILNTSTISGVLGGGTSFTKDGPGTLVLSNAANTYGGPTTVNGGVLAGGVVNALPATSDLTLNPGGVFNVNGLNQTVASLAGGGLLTDSGAAALFTMGGDNASTSFSGQMASATAGNLIVNKVGTGTFTIAAPQTFTGTTNVNGGVYTFTPAGSLAGILSVNSNGTLAALAGNTITLGTLVTTGNSNTTLPLSGPSTTPLFNATGALTPLGQSKLTVTGLSGTGTYALIGYGGPQLTAAQMANFTVNASSPGNFVVLKNDPLKLDLVVEAPGSTNKWTGAGGATWDTSTASWTSSPFQNGQQVTFDDTGSNTNISSTGTISPQSITFNNSAVNYSIANNIAGNLAGGMVKNGTAIAQLTGINTGAGAIALNAGTLRVSATTAGNGLGSGAVTLAAGTTLQIDSTASTATNGLTGRSFSAVAANDDITLFNFTGAAVDTRTYFAAGTATLPGPSFYTGGPATNFSLQWTGKLNIGNPGPYIFYTASDDGSRIFIDGQLVANNDGGKGVTEVGGAVQLTSGLHDIRVDYNQGTGGDSEAITWQGPGIPKGIIPGANLFTPETSSSTGTTNLVALGNNLSVTGNATLNSTGTNNIGIQFGGLNSSNATTLTVAGNSAKQVRFGNTTVTGTATYVSTPDLALGQLNDNGVAATIVKQGTGRLILDASTPGAGSTLVAGTLIDIQGGDAVIQGINLGSNPIGAAKLQINGGNVLLDTKGGNVVFDNPINLAQAGILKVLPDAATVTLGSTPSNGISLNANALTIDVYGGARSGFATTSVAAGATLQVNGIISGSGAVTVQSSQFNAEQAPVPGALTLTAANTLTGPLTVNGVPFTGPAVAGVNPPQNVTPITLTLSGAGSLLSASSLGFNTARLTLDNSATNVANRIADTQDIILNSSTLNFIGSTTAASNETFQNLNVNAGFNTVTMSNTATAAATSLTAGAALQRNNNATVAFQGTTLGGAATVADLIKITTSVAPQLVGGAGAAGSTTMSILPYAIAANANGLPQSWMFATSDVNGIRPLTAAEYKTSATSTLNTDNVRDSAVTGTLTVTGKTVNSYVLDDSTGGVTTAGNLTATLNGTLQITSGALLFTNSGFTGAANNLVQGLVLNGGTTPSLSFGAEGIISVMDTTGATLGATLPITGSGGLTVSGNGPLTIASTGNSFTGNVTVNGTTLLIAADTSLGAATNNIQLGGGILKFNLTGISLASTRTVSLLAGTFGTFDTSLFSGTVAGQVTGSGSLVKINGNTLTLSNTANNYTGGTYVYGGTLVTNNVPQGNIVDNAITTFNQTANGSYGGVISGIGSFTVTGGSGVTLTKNNTFAGGATVANGTIVDGLDNALPLGGAVTIGSTGAAGNLDLTNANQTVGPYTVASTVAGASTTTIGTGKTLTVLGNVLIGSNASATDVTNAVFTGGGSMVVTDVGGTVQLGGATGATNADQVTADLTGLLSFTANLGATGLFRLGDVNANTVTDASTLLLPTTTAITAGTFDVGSDAAGNVSQVVKLGSGVTTLNATTVNVGAVTGRALGVLQFNGATGSIVLRAADGVSPANVNLVNGATGTGAAVSGTIDVTGHNADLLIGTLTMSARSAGNAGAGNATSVFSFDTGTLNIGTAILSNKTGTTDFNGTSTATLNVNGGTAIIGSIALAANTSTGTGTPGLSSGIVNFNGGNVTLGGDITKTGATGGGTASATFNLAGATLNMQSHNIGSLAQPIDVPTFASGTLQNLAQFNGGLANGAIATLTKTSTGTLTLAGTNTYTGATTINQGTVVTGSATGVPANTVLTVGLAAAGNNATFDLNGFNVQLGGLASAGTTPANDLVTNNGAGTGTNTLTVNNDAATSNADFTYNGLITDGPTAHIALVKNGSRLLALGGSNTYTGPTTINAGILLANTNIPAASATGLGAVTVNSGGTLAGGSSAAPGFINSGSANTAVTVAAGGTISAGNGVTTTSTTGLLVTSGGTAPTTYSHVWAGSGNYAWKVNGTATTGSAPVQVTNGGATVGTTDTAGGANWDMLTVQTLNVTATSTTPFNINVVPLTSSTGFNPAGIYTWTIADVTGANGIYLNGSNSPAALQGATTSPFGAMLAALNLNASQLSTLYGASASGFSLGVTSDGGAGQDIVVNYNPAPEPTSLMLLGLGAGGLLLRRRRRQSV